MNSILRTIGQAVRGTHTIAPETPAVGREIKALFQGLFENGTQAAADQTSTIKDMNGNVVDPKAGPIIDTLVGGFTQGKFQLIENKGLSSPITLIERIATRRFHGTTKEALGEQLTRREFNDRGGRVYFASKETAVSYAAQKAKSEKGTPVVVEVVSNQKALDNDSTPDGMGRGLGAYSYYPTKESAVKIVRVYDVSTLEMKTFAEIFREHYANKPDGLKGAVT